MMAYQKAPQPHNIAPHLVNAHHRRHPSAPPAVIVQPTRTPGLLSLSKPPRPSPQRQSVQRSHQRTMPKSKSAAATPAVTPIPPAQVLKPAVEIPDKKMSRPSTPEKNLPQSLRGRPVKATREKAAKRSASQTSVHGRRNHARQPSPPIQPPQAEVVLPAQTNQFDPFLDEFSHDSRPVRTTPTIASLPSGKLARRRQPIPFALQEPSSMSKAVTVPRRAQPSVNPQVSRSEPTYSHMPRGRPTQNAPRPPPRRSATIGSVNDDGFPICDDLTEIGAPADVGATSDLDDDSDSSSGPVTPVRRANWQQPFIPSAAFQFDDGPRTAPLSSISPGAFPFNFSPSPPSRALRSKHVRAPSEGTNLVFHMSSDEESSSSKGLFRTSTAPPRRTGSAGIPGYKDRAAHTASLFEKGGYFASSVFQNSPSPDALPPPNF